MCTCVCMRDYKLDPLKGNFVELKTSVSMSAQVCHIL